MESYNGDLLSELSLRVNEDGEWQVAGTIDGKDVNQILETEVQPVSVLGEMLAIQRLAAAPDIGRGEITSWLPSLEPTVFSTVSIEIDGDAPGVGVVSRGPMRLTSEFESTGSLRSGTMELAGARLNFERVFASGEIP